MMAGSLSRRAAFSAGIGSVGAMLMPSAAYAQAPIGSTSMEETAVRKYYRLWETKDWAPFDTLLADDFTFTSANDDDHISKVAFKRECWDTQIDFIKSFDLETIITRPGEVFVKYLCHTKNGKQFRNVEYHRIRDRRIVAIECYFGGKSTFASAVSSRRS